eukprot:TRINITY_DN10283_c1_g2_i1.p1 TRINITY_DN10283_c1_g2~~TRINITY_DN10283_c1_g2_i1.p1  ORF type:complete len:354 (+),score=100.20 TRINITY_DN10283_c1_g2_i1:75-1064(+)
MGKGPTPEEAAADSPPAAASLDQGALLDQCGALDHLTGGLSCDDEEPAGAPSPEAAPARPEADPAEPRGSAPFAPGCRVRADGLQVAVELNGLVGTVLSSEEDDGRVRIDFGAAHGERLVRRCNLTVAASADQGKSARVRPREETAEGGAPPAGRKRQRRRGGARRDPSEWVPCGFIYPDTPAVASAPAGGQTALLQQMQAMLGTMQAAMGSPPMASPAMASPWQQPMWPGSAAPAALPGQPMLQPLLPLGQAPPALPPAAAPPAPPAAGAQPAAGRPQGPALAQLLLKLGQAVQKARVPPAPAPAPPPKPQQQSPAELLQQLQAAFAR